MEIPVSDPFWVVKDKEMPFLAQAINPGLAQRQFDKAVDPSAVGMETLRLCAIRVRRYKPGRRCLVEYDFAAGRPHTGQRILTILGKARAKGLDRSTYQVQRSLWQNGFSDTSEDHISVAEPLGLIPDFHMGLQRKMPGASAAEVLAGAGGAALARRIAEAAHKLHQAGIPAARSHTISDEMVILSTRLAELTRFKPTWEKRLERLLEACAELAASIQPPEPVGIHRDFYADQILVDKDRLYIVDLDLYCMGDPALDIGNFTGHIAEYSLRSLGNPEALRAQEQALEDRFAELAGEPVRTRVKAYAALTLARHISISTQLPERQAYTEKILELCEERQRSEYS